MPCRGLLIFIFDHFLGTEYMRYIRYLMLFQNRKIFDIRSNFTFCDNTALQGTQKWVTLQPDDSYNPQELCSSKRSLNIADIAKEIADELPRQSRQVFRNKEKSPSRGRFSSTRNQRRGKGSLDPVCLGIGCGRDGHV